MNPLFLIPLFIVLALPFETWINNAYRRESPLEDIYSQPKDVLHFSKAPLMFGFSLLFLFLKGYLTVFLTLQSFFYQEYFTVFTIAAALGLQLWAPLLKFKQNGPIFPMLLGIYTALFTPFIVIYPVIFGILLFVLNSLLMGQLVAVILLLIITSFLGLPLFALPLNFVIFLLVFVKLRAPLFEHLEEQKWTLLKSYQNR